MAKSNWEDNFSSIVKNTLPLEDNKEWRFSLEEHKTKGTMQMNIRKFQLDDGSGGYSGPTKNGFIEPVRDLQDVERLEKAFSEFFKKVKEML